MILYAVTFANMKITIKKDLKMILLVFSKDQ